MTRQTPPLLNPPYISACVQTGGQSRLPWQLLLLSTFLADVTKVHSSVERQEKGRPWRSVCLFALSFCRGLLIWDDSHNLSRQDSQPLCDYREIKRGSLLTSTLPTSPSGFILVFLIINSFCLCWLLFIVSPCLSLISRLEQFLANSTNGALFLSVVITCRAGTTGARDKTDGRTSKRKGWEVKESRKAWWVRQREKWLCVCVSDRGVQ